MYNSHAKFTSKVLVDTIFITNRYYL